MSNLIKLFTPGLQNPPGRFRVALGEDALIYGASDIASITFRMEDGGLVLEHMAVGQPRTRRAVMPCEHIQLTVNKQRVLLLVQAVTPSHVVLDAAVERGADVALVLAATA